MRKMLKETFFYQKYLEDQRDPRKVFVSQFETAEKNFKEFIGKEWFERGKAKTISFNQSDFNKFFI